MIARCLLFDETGRNIVRLLILHAVFGAKVEASPLITEAQKVVDADASTYDNFGWSVSASGDYALIGSPQDDNNAQQNVGSAYIFKRSTSWTQQLQLTAGDQYDNFGMSVSLDGDYALVGAHRAYPSGAAYVFYRNGANWPQQQKLIAADSSKVSYFGRDVALSGDYALISDYYAGEFGDQRGAAYIFKRSGSSWTQQQKLTASDGADGDKFGTRVSLFGDYALIGADEADSNRGAAYIFKRSGSFWTQQQKLIASDRASGDFFGSSVSITEDYAAIGSPNDATRKGAVYIFARSGSTWTQRQKLVASDAATYKYFGDVVSLSTDLLVIGTKYHEQAYLFRRSGSLWTEANRFQALDGVDGDGFGSTSVDISGSDVVIGSYQDDTHKGSAYFFSINCDASSAPTNGGAGTCTSSLAAGSSCQPTCNTGYTVSGTATCSSSGTLTQATCALTPTSSSGDCKCSCCSSNSCTASVVGYFDAGSSYSCTNDACRTQFPSQCPSLGSSGIVSSIYTSPTSPSSAWYLQNGDSLTLSSNSCSAGYTQCQATCAQGYSVSLSGAAYTLTPTASSSSLPSGCSCYTLGPATPTTSTWSGSIPVGPGASVRGTVTETSATTYTVVLSTTPSPCTLTYTKSTGGSLGASSGASRRTRTFPFAARIAGALTFF